MYLSISDSSVESCTISLGDFFAEMIAPPEIFGISLGGEKYTESSFRDLEEKTNEEEEPRKRIWEETITKYLAPPVAFSMF